MVDEAKAFREKLSVYNKPIPRPTLSQQQPADGSTLQEEQKTPFEQQATNTNPKMYNIER